MYGSLILLDQRSVVAAKYSTALRSLSILHGCFTCSTGNAALEKKKKNNCAKRYCTFCSICQVLSRSLCYSRCSLETFLWPNGIPLQLWLHCVLSDGDLLYNLTMDVLVDAGPSAFATNGQLLVGLQAFTTLCILRYFKKIFVLHHCRLLFFKFLSYLNAI